MNSRKALGSVAEASGPRLNCWLTLAALRIAAGLPAARRDRGPPPPCAHRCLCSPAGPLQLIPPRPILPAATCWPALHRAHAARPPSDRRATSDGATRLARDFGRKPGCPNTSRGPNGCAAHRLPPSPEQAGDAHEERPSPVRFARSRSRRRADQSWPQNSKSSNSVALSRSK